MVHVTKQQKGDIFSVKLAGSIEESVDFMTLIGMPSSNRMEVNCKEVARINSMGVKAWMKFFQNVYQKGVAVRFVECSTAVVELMNMISNFACGGTVESLYVPYVCRDCKKELLGLYRVADLKKLAFKVPDLSCPKCQGTASFDDNLNEYFGFLAGQKR